MNKNNKGQMAMVGLLIMTFIAIIVGVSLLNGGVYQNIGTLTRMETANNHSFNFPNATTVVLRGQAVSDLVIRNSTNDVVPASNYTVVNREVSTGVIRVTLTNTTAVWFTNKPVNATYTYEPIGYDTNGGNRAVIGLIAIFAALALVVVAMVPILRDNILDIMD